MCCIVCPFKDVVRWRSVAAAPWRLGDSFEDIAELFDDHINVPQSKPAGDTAGVCGDPAAFRARTGPPRIALIRYKLGFNQNYYTFALILLAKIALCSKSH